MRLLILTAADAEPGDRARMVLQIDAFIELAGASLETFRYFQDRDPVDAISSHLMTVIGFDGDAPIAYGHLDQDREGHVWLGLCVATPYQRRGHGHRIMRALMSHADHGNLDVKLTVDDTNVVARRLYERYGFDEVRTEHGVVFMEA